MKYENKITLTLILMMMVVGIMWLIVDKIFTWHFYIMTGIWFFQLSRILTSDKRRKVK